MVDHTGFEPVTPCMSSKCSNRAELMIHVYSENGARDRDRTCDLELRRLLLYPTELLGQGSIYNDLSLYHSLYLYSRTVGIIWKIGGKRGDFDRIYKII